MVNQRVFEWNSILQDLFQLYHRLTELGMKYRNGKVYLPDLEEQDGLSKQLELFSERL